MDALPIDEATGLGYASCHAGVMHACGHDGHTAMLLAAAHHLAERGRFSGTLNLIFQPAEEGGGGALRMMEDGLFDKYPCDAVFAMHNMPGLPQGRLVLREGAAMASSDYATVTLTGVGGHGAMPHRAADPVVAAASIVMALQTVVSRNIDPLQMAVVTVGALHAGKANNVIPQSATLELSVRALDREVRSTLEQRIKALVAAQAESFGVKAQIDWRPGYAVLVNTPEETAFAREVALELLGPERVTLQGPALPGSEDFAFMLERVPGSYLLIGNGDGDSARRLHGAQPRLRLQRRQRRHRRGLLGAAGRALPALASTSCAACGWSGKSASGSADHQLQVSSQYGRRRQASRALWRQRPNHPARPTMASASKSLDSTDPSSIHRHPRDSQVPDAGQGKRRTAHPGHCEPTQRRDKLLGKIAARGQSRALT